MESLLQVGLSNAVAALVLAAIALCVGLFCRRPAVVHGLWLLVLLKLVTPPLVRVPLPWPTARTAESTHVDDAASPTEDSKPILLDPEEIGDPGAVEPNPPHVEDANFQETPLADAAAASGWWQIPLLGVWTAGTCVWFGLAAWRLRRFRLLLRHAKLASPALRLKTRGLARKMGLGDGPEVWLIPGRLPPMLWCAFGPTRLLMPADLPDLIDEKQLETILLHELAHLVRRDHWVRYLEFVTLGLYWWHPIVWFARRELREAEEQCCDAWVISTLPNAGRAYSLALLETLDFLSEPRQAALPALASGAGPVSDLKRRLKMILTGTTPRALGWRGALGLLALATVLLPALPAWALDDKKDEVKDVRFVVRLVNDGEADPAVAAIDEKIARLKAELAEKLAIAERVRFKTKLAEAVKADGDMRVVEGQLKNDQVIRVLAEADRVIAAKLAEDARAKILTARWAPQAGKKVLLLQREGKTILELPPEMVVAERDGKLILEIPLAAVTRRTAVSGSGASKTPASEQRIATLEKQLADLMKELESLRRESKENP